MKGLRSPSCDSCLKNNPHSVVGGGGVQSVNINNRLLFVLRHSYLINEYKISSSACSRTVDVKWTVRRRPKKIHEHHEIAMKVKKDI